MAEWTFLTTHAILLSYLVRYPNITARRLSDAVGITERTTRKVIGDLLTGSYISKKREGRRVRYHVNIEKRLRHHTHRDHQVRDLLAALGSTGPYPGLPRLAPGAREALPPDSVSED